MEAQTENMSVCCDYKTKYENLRSRYRSNFLGRWATRFVESLDYYDDEFPPFWVICDHGYNAENNYGVENWLSKYEPYLWVDENIYIADIEESDDDDKIPVSVTFKNITRKINEESGCGWLNKKIE